MTRLNPVGAFTLLAVACLTIMVGCVIVPGLPTIAAALGVPHAASWLVTLPSLGVILFGPFVGRLIGRIGTRNALCAGLFLYGLLGLAGVFLHGVWLVFADRVFLGGATAMIMASGTGLISEFYDGDERLTMIARQGMAIELGGVIFLSIGGLLAALGWQWPFLLYLMAWVFLAMVLIYVPRPSPGTAMEAPKAAETRAKPLWDVFLAGAASMIFFFTAITLLPARLHSLGFSEVTTGYFLSFISLVAVGAAFFMPRLTSRVGETGTLILAFGAYATAHVIYCAFDLVPAILAGGVLMGMGFGLSIPLVNHMAVERSFSNARGRNLAFLSVAIFGGQFLSSFLSLAPGSGAAAFGLAAVLSLAMVACFAWRRLTQPAAAAEAE